MKYWKRLVFYGVQGVALVLAWAAMYGDFDPALARPAALVAGVCFGFWLGLICGIEWLYKHVIKESPSYETTRNILLRILE